MKFRNYFKDKIFYIIIFLVTTILIFLILRAFATDYTLIIVIELILFIFFAIALLYSYFRRLSFYNNLFSNVEKLDKAYLVLETLKKPDFYDGKLLCDILYEIDKSMIENLKKLEFEVDDFRDYIEMWIHEVKIPLSALTLMMHNNKFDVKVVEQINKIEDYIEQVLYYVRSENAEKDYLINKVNLKKIINKIALKNKDELLFNNIDLISKDVDCIVNTDMKWLEFIIDQIINNSIKYRRNIDNSYIKIYIEKDENLTRLFILDNGIGIPEYDLKRVFDKSFTGYNGRIKSKSTGMGLYIAYKLCKKLGHKISITSKKDEYTKVCITFNSDTFYDVI